MKNEKKTKKKKKKTGKYILLALVILLLILLGIQCSRQGEKVVSSYEKNVNAISEIDYSKRQKALDAIVEEGKMNVNYSSKAVFKGTRSESFNIKNIKNNHYPIVFEIYDENEECIYTSKKIEPGYEMTCIELVKEMVPGIHPCKLKVGYAQEGNVSSVFPIEIEVK